MPNNETVNVRCRLIILTSHCARGVFDDPLLLIIIFTDSHFICKLLRESRDRTRHSELTLPVPMTTCRNTVPFSLVLEMGRLS